MYKLPLLKVALASGLLSLGTLALPCDAQTTRRPVSGFNVFSVEQDVEIGRESAREAEKQLPLLTDRTVDAYVNRIMQRLSAHAPGARYPYTVKVVNAEEINAFALPGGPLYINRGLITAARTEAELAGVMAHEISHIALRHGTNQASKAYLGQAGLGLLGGLLGSSTASKVVGTIGGFGLNAAFLKFSRDDEHEADEVGAHMMALAGYSPVAMADFFAVLRAQQGRDPGKVERFFSSHPAPVNREARIRTLASSMTVARTPQVGGFAAIKSRVTNVTVATAETPWPVTTTTSSGRLDSVATVRVNVPAPSARLTPFTHPRDFFQIQHPDNWRAFSSTAFAVSMAPEGGVVQSTSGQPHMLYGMIVNHYEPFEGVTDRYQSSLQRSYAPFEDRTRPRGALEDATDDLIRNIIRSNSYLNAEPGSARVETLDAERGYSVLLSGRSPITGEDERVTVYTRALADHHVIYALCIAPQRLFDEANRTCVRMLRTLSINEEAVHKGGGN